MAVTAAFNRATEAEEKDPLVTPEEADLAWRIILMIGAIPAGQTFYWRMSMPETARFTALVEKNVMKATTDMGKVMTDFHLDDSDPLHRSPPPQPPTYSLLSKHFLRHHGRHLFACAAAWFLVDIPHYSSTLFQSHICRHFFPPNEVNAFQDTYNVAKFQAIIAVASTIPGYFATVYAAPDKGWRPGIGMMHALVTLGSVCLAGAVHTYLFTPQTKMRSLEENEVGEVNREGNGNELGMNEVVSSSRPSSPLSVQPLIRQSPE
ncbi:hypothetical protein ZIOFF_007663 [Zingiber officinale]|uniref:Uncharacterized protein n=1 Tax=Zingiber officinale TaxID=94328 RepID=A0A8J5LWN7_ZINOF|nr:hypothetical protein ZIOFF_007663 [Zingiber officinale]